MVARPDIHRIVGTWIAILTAALALAGVVFTTGDASQRLSSQGTALVRMDNRIDVLEAKRETHDAMMDRRMTDLEVLVARIDQATEDTRQTAHRLENKKNLKDVPFY